MPETRVAGGGFLRCRSIVLLLGLVFCLRPAAAQPGGRTRINFNVGWKFYLGTPGGSPQDPGFNDSSWESVSVPHTLKLTSLDLDGSADDNHQKTFHRYVGWYRKRFRVNAAASGKVFLEFEGSHQVTDVWVNGRHAGKHMIGGYTPFHFDITDAVDRSADNVVVIRVDNTLNPDVPPDGGTRDYILFGGLYRNVYLVTTEKLHVTFPWEDTYAGVFVTTPTVKDENATISVRTTVRNEYDTRKLATVVTRILDAERRVVMKMSQTREIPAGADVTFLETKVLSDDVRLWWPDSPYMYTAHTTVLTGETATDAVETPFGIRKFELAPGKGFLVNGQPYELIGVNWHQMYPYVGNAVPDSLRWKDALRLKKAGIRIVRMAHYPHDNSFVEACDRLGILLYAEPPTWIEFGNDAFQDNLEQAMRRMIRNYRHHPSVLFYGAGVNHLGPVERLQSAAKEEDPTRITASNGTDWTGPHDAGAADLYATMIFSGWDTSESFLFGIEASGSRDSENNQRLISTFNALPSHIGQAVWTGNDYNTFHNGKPLSRGGMVDYSGIPRDHYYWYKSELTAEPMVYIANRWTGPTAAPAPGDRVAQPETGKVRVFSNCEEVELFLNGKSLGKRSPARTPDKANLNHPSIVFDVDFQPGELKAVGLIGGEARATYVVRTPVQPDHLRVEVDTAERSFVADGADMVWAYAHLEDHNGTTVSTAREKVTFTVSGPGQIVGGAEIGSNPVAAENGIARVLVRAGLKPGTITLTASADGLKPASASFATTAFSETIPVQPYFDPLRIKVDLGSSGLTSGSNGANMYHVQPGWTAWVGSGEADETKSFAELGGATVVLKKANGSSGVAWLNPGDLAGALNYMAEDGVMAPASDGLSLTFQGLKPGRYQMTTYHHLPKAPERRGGGSSINILVDDAAAKNRLVANGVRPSGGSPVRKPGPASAVFTFSVDAGGTVTVRLVAGSAPGDIWLNGFKLEGLIN